MHGDHMEGLKPLPPPWAAQGGEFIDKAVAAAGSVDSNTKRSQGLLPCVSRVYFEGTGVKPLTGPNSLRQNGANPDPPHRSPPNRIPHRPGGLPIRAQRYCLGRLRPE